MQWEYLFSEQILRRGARYYREGKVKNLINRGSTYQAMVEGTLDYDVEIYLTDKARPRMVCNCAYDGNCKHMAAVLYTIEGLMAGGTTAQTQARTGKRTIKSYMSQKVFPFKKSRDQKAGKEYRYFDLEEIMKEFVIYEKTFDRAQHLLQSGVLKPEELKLGYPNRMGSQEMVGVYNATVIEKGKPYNVQVVFGNDCLFSADCSVPNCACHYKGDSMYRYENYVFLRNQTNRDEKEQLCAHAIAVLLKLKERLDIENLGDATDNFGQQMIRDFRSMKAWERAGEATELIDNLMMEPQFEIDEDGCYVSFKAGKDKLYVVKNLNEFVNHVEEKKTHTFGTKTIIDFATTKISETAKKYYRFIWNIVLDERRRTEHLRETSRYYYEQSSETIKGKIPLYGKRLDDMFELVNGGTYNCSDKRGYKSKKISLTFEEKDIKLNLCVYKQINDKNIFEGIRMEGRLPQFQKGLEYQYYMQGDSFCRLSKERSAQFAPLIEAAYDSGELSIVVGRQNLSEFYYRILPMIKKFAKVKEDDSETVQKYLPPEAEFLFLLDAEGKNIICEAVVKYGDVSCNLLDWRIGDLKKEDFRDVQRETEVLTTVEGLFSGRDWEQKKFHCEENVDACYEFLQTGVSVLLEIGEVKSTDRFRALRVRKSIPITVGVAVKSDIMNLNISSNELTPQELLDILNQYRQKKKYYRLKNGDFLDLEEQSLQELSDMMEMLHVSPKEFVKGKMQIPLYRALYLDKMLEQSEVLYTNRDKTFKQLVKNFKTVDDSDFVIPENLQGVMRKYQKFGHRWLRTLEQCGFGGILADDMGLGKTLQVISVLAAAEKEYPAIVITPASLVYNWREEFKKFAPQLNVCTVTGSQEQRKQLLEEYQQYDVLVTSYDLLKRDIAEYEGRQFSYEIIDEAQYIKNHTTAAAKSVKVLQSKKRYALTGTPIENRLSELWSIFDYLMPGFLYGYDTFKKELETPITKNKDADATKRLKRMVSPFILRRLKNDVLKDLPDKLEEVCYAHMEEKQQQLYDGQVVHMRQMLEKQSDENFKKNKLQILAELTKIRQICCDPSLLVENYAGESAKRTACMDLIQSAIEGEHKILLFSQFTSMLQLLEEDLKKEKIAYYKITGETTKEKRVELVQSFNEDDTPLFLISLKAGGTGLNLTGADIVIHYDPWWNLAVQNQATDRAHRIGQTKVVSVYKLIVKDSIEEKILQMQEQKKNLADEILNGENGGIVDMTREELLELIQS